jgi:outer membrane protein
MKSTKFALLFLLIITVSFTSEAQKEWSLEECINYAIANNIQVKRQELSADNSEKIYFQSKMEVLPNLNANGQHYLNSGKAIDYETYSYVNESFQGGSVSLSSEVNLFSGLQTFNTIRKNKLDLLVQLESVDKVKNDISLNVATAYLQILLSRELRDNAKQQLEITLVQIEKTKKLVEIGNAARGSLLQIEAQAAGERAALTDAENNVKIAYLNLSQLLNLETSEGFEIQTPANLELTLNTEFADVNIIYNDAIVILPEIKGAEYGLKSSERNLSLAYGRISPSLVLGYQYSSRYNELSTNIEDPAADYPYTQQLGDNASQFIYVGLRIPIFNNWNTMSGISRSKILVNDSRLNLDLQKQNLYKSIQQARTQAIAALERYKANTQAVESMEEAFRYTEQKYQVGLVDILEFKTAKNSLNKTKSDALQAKYECIFRIKILDFYRGEQILF